VNSQQAREILILFRPGSNDQADPEIAQALLLTKHDLELAQWFEEHCALQQAVRANFRQILVPEGLKEQILSERRVKTSSLFRKRVLALATILFLLLLGLSNFYLRPRPDTSFASFRHRMAGNVLRMYPKMDLETNDLAQIREYLGEHKGHGDYLLPTGLKNTTGTGCKVLDWRGKNVSMICFNSGTNGKPKVPDLFLFIVDSSAIKGTPNASSPEFAQISKLLTASWSEGNKTYVLGTLGNEQFLKTYLGP
jgi:hypothetical protein